jgi:hypothetical protein
MNQPIEEDSNDIVDVLDIKEFDETSRGCFKVQFNEMEDGTFEVEYYYFGWRGEYHQGKSENFKTMGEAEKLFNRIGSSSTARRLIKGNNHE